MVPPRATSRIGGTETNSTAVNMIRPPYRSVSTPTTIRPIDPTRTGIATSAAVAEGASSSCAV